MNAPDKKSFILYCDQYNLIGKLSDEQAGNLIKNIYLYCCNGGIIPKIDDPLVDIVFTSLQISLDRDNKKYLKIVERNRNNGKLGGRPKEPKEPTGLSGNPKKPKKADSGSDSDSVNENDSDNEQIQLFDMFWEIYGKKVDKKACLSKFNKLKQPDIDSIFENLPAYVESTPDPTYRKNPITYLNNESWNDQIIPKGKLNGKPKNYTGPDTRQPILEDRLPEY